ncbi:hypothetical protein BDZ91DRAFT_713101 [Kalaharituber pfeilii]|nr:hypothetical protein BDZ91DRAFT_713101 [Kalaharituber pfeilii]
MRIIPTRLVCDIGMLSTSNNSNLLGKHSTSGGAVESSRNREPYSINDSTINYQATCTIKMENSKPAEP